MSDITLASKGYVDKLAAIQFYYDGNIYNDIIKPAAPMPYAFNHEVNIYTKFNKTGFIRYIDLMLVTLDVPDLGEPVFAGLLKTGGMTCKVGDIKNRSDFMLFSKKKYTAGSYNNVEFATEIIVPEKYSYWPVGPDGAWTGWLDTHKEDGPVYFWSETETEGVYICVGKTGPFGFFEPLRTDKPIKQIKDHFQIRATKYANALIQFTTRMCVQFDTEPSAGPSLVTTAYVNSAFGLTGGSSELASVEYVDEMNKLREVWPKEYYPYQPDLTIE